MSPGPDTQDSDVFAQTMESSLPVVTPGSKAEVPHTLADNPYLLVLNKKTRALKKKLEKIKKTETLVASGKTLNEEQKVLLAGRSNLECALKEHERVRGLLEEVAKEEVACKKDEAPDPPVVPEESLGLAILNRSNPDLTVEGGSAPEILSVCVGTETEMLQGTEVAAQTDISGPMPPAGMDPGEVAEATAVAVSTAKAAAVVEGREKMRSGVRKLLRLLHVTSRFEARGEQLPSEVDFFSKVLLGKTVLPDEADFESCLEQSTEKAIYYLGDCDGMREVARGLTFQRLEEVVSGLSAQEAASPPVAGPGNFTGPVFDFFADGS
ncbi:unnamed protein product, partial [Choristocarpus tenellus]